MCKAEPAEGRCGQMGVLGWESGEVLTGTFLAICLLLYPDNVGLVFPAT